MSPLQYDITDAQMEALIRGYRKAEQMVLSGEVRTKEDIERVLQAEFNKTFPDNYPVPVLKVFLDKNTTTAGQYNPASNELYVNLAFSPMEQISTIIHEREHAIQAKKVSDYIAQDLVAKGKPLTSENIVAASSASISVGRVDENGKPILKNGKQIIDRVTKSVSIDVARQSVKDYQNNKRLSPSQKDEAKKLLQGGYTPEALQKRQKLQGAVKRAELTYKKDLNSYRVALNNYNEARASGASGEKIKQLQKIAENAYKKATTSQSALKLTVKNYENGLIEESQAYKVERRFGNIQKRLENQNRTVKTSSFANLDIDFSELNPAIFNTQIAAVDPTLANLEGSLESIAMRRAQDISSKLKEAGILEGSDEFQAAFVGVVKDIKHISPNEKKDILEIQGINSKVIDSQLTMVG
jgi:hypothetical protein